MATGNDALDKAAFSKFVEGVLWFKETPSKHTVQRAIASILILTSYVLRSAEERGNHWARFEAWTIVASYILGSANRFNLAAKFWEPSFNLCNVGIEAALNELAQECKSSEHFVEGHPLTDGYFFHERATIIAGLLSAYALSHTIARSPCDVEEVIGTMNKRAAKQLRIWGESAIPFAVCIAICLEKSQTILAENIIVLALKLITSANGGEGRGLADPYHGPEECVRLALNLDEGNMETFVGQSYAAEALIDFLARRLRRQALASLWYGITQISLAQVRPLKPWEWFRWHTDNAELIERLPGRPERWAALLDAANKRDTTDVPTLLKQYSAFLPYILKVLEDALVA